MAEKGIFLKFSDAMEGLADSEEITEAEAKVAEAMSKLDFSPPNKYPEPMKLTSSWEIAAKDVEAAVEAAQASVEPDQESSLTENAYLLMKDVLAGKSVNAPTWIPTSGQTSALAALIMGSGIVLSFAKARTIETIAAKFGYEGFKALDILSKELDAKAGTKPLSASEILSVQPMTAATGVVWSYEYDGVKPMEQSVKGSAEPITVEMSLSPAAMKLLEGLKSEMNPAIGWSSSGKTIALDVNKNGDSFKSHEAVLNFEDSEEPFKFKVKKDKTLSPKEAHSDAIDKWLAVSKEELDNAKFFKPTVAVVPPGIKSALDKLLVSEDEVKKAGSWGEVAVTAEEVAEKTQAMVEAIAGAHEAMESPMMNAGKKALKVTPLEIHADADPINIHGSVKAETIKRRASKLDDDLLDVLPRPKVTFSAGCVTPEEPLDDGAPLHWCQRAIPGASKGESGWTALEARKPMSIRARSKKWRCMAQVFVSTGQVSVEYAFYASMGLKVVIKSNYIALEFRSWNEQISEKIFIRPKDMRGFLEGCLDLILDTTDRIGPSPTVSERRNEMKLYRAKRLDFICPYAEESHRIRKGRCE